MFYSGHQVLKKTRSLTEIIPKQDFKDITESSSQISSPPPEQVSQEYHMSQLTTNLIDSQQKEFIEFIENRHDLKIFNNEINVYSVNLEKYHKVLSEDSISPDIFAASTSPNTEKVNITTDSEPLAARVSPSDFMSIKVLSEVCSMTPEEAEKLIHDTRTQQNDPTLDGENLLSAAIGIFYAVKTPAAST